VKYVKRIKSLSADGGKGQSPESDHADP